MPRRGQAGHIVSLFEILRQLLHHPAYGKVIGVQVVDIKSAASFQTADDAVRAAAPEALALSKETKNEAGGAIVPSGTGFTYTGPTPYQDPYFSSARTTRRSLFQTGSGSGELSLRSLGQAEQQNAIAAGAGVAAYEAATGVGALGLSESPIIVGIGTYAGPIGIAVGVATALGELFADIFGGGGGTPLPRQLKYGAHPIYIQFLGISRDLIVTEGSAFQGSVVTKFGGLTPVAKFFVPRSDIPQDLDSPGEGWIRKGPNWFNPNTNQSIHPDPNHPLPKGPHHDFHVRGQGKVSVRHMFDQLQFWANDLQIGSIRKA